MARVYPPPLVWSSMSEPILNQNLKRFLHTLLVWLPLWLGTTVGFGVLGAFYAFFLKEDYWLASQALLVRDEANTGSLRLGRFDSESQMKAAQETILEVARNHQVVQEALLLVGEEKRWWPSIEKEPWPSLDLVRGTAGSLISIRAPKGAEFGATEVIYLDVKQRSPKRAVAFNQSLCQVLEARLQQMRKQRAESIQHELLYARDLARDQLRIATEQLQAIERGVGLELSDLRGMTDIIGGGGGSGRQHLDQLKAELRVAEASHQELLNQLGLLEEAIADPTAFVVAPSNVITSQPGLKRLREGYAEAQLNASQLSGRFTDEHPLLVAARRTQDSIQGRLLTELQSSKINLQQEIQTNQQKIDRLRKLQAETEEKLNLLADKRAEYANLIAEVKTRATILEKAESELAEAEAAGTASSSTSLISRMDAPIVSERPLGPGGSTITLASLVLGLMTGIGLVLILSPADGGRRFGRRATDVGRRASDRSPTEAAPILPTTTASGSPPTPVARPTVERSDVASKSTTPVAESVSDPQALASAWPPPTATFPADNARSASPDVPGVEPFPPSEVSPAPVTETTAGSLTVSCATKSPLRDAAATKVAAAAIEREEIRASEDEHPRDPLFREFGKEPLANDTERRQHPRATNASTKPITLGLRPRS